MPQVKLHVDKYENMIFRRGRPVRWQEAIICSCWNTQTGQPLFSCEACHGTGYMYGPPYDGIALVMSITAEKEFLESGVFEAGDAVMTVPKRYPVQLPNGLFDNTRFTDNPMYEIGMYDLVTLLDDEVKSSEVLTRGTSFHGKPADTLANPEITRIKRIQQVDSVTGEVTIYTEGQDFQLNNNQIEWIGNQPAMGTNYSVTYLHRPVYSVFTTLPKPRHQDGQDLPRYVALRYRMGGLKADD